MAPLLDAILEHVPPPAGDPAAPLALLVAMVERDAFLGPIATGRIAHGTMRPGDRVRVMHHAGALCADVGVCGALTPQVVLFLCVVLLFNASQVCRGGLELKAASTGGRHGSCFQAIAP